MKNLDPLLLKAMFDPDSLTSDDKRTLFLQAWEIVLNFQTTAQLKHTHAQLVNREEEFGVGIPGGAEHVAEVMRMVEGKIALRELGCLEQRQPELGGFPIDFPRPKKKKKPKAKTKPAPKAKKPRKPRRKSD